jgi:ribosomal protein S4
MPCLPQFKKRLPTTATPAGTGIQTVLTANANANANANRKRNSKTAYRQRQRQQEEEFKHRLQMTEKGRRVLVLGFHARIHRIFS